jgi:hypothetical protein
MTTIQTYTLNLILLECLEGQEYDGDEPYLKLNGDLIWRWDLAGKKMHDTLNAPSWTNAFDLRNGMFRTLAGWAPSPHYQAGQFEFKGLSGKTVLELWESDEHESPRGEDDFLGNLTVTLESIRMGDQIVEFNQNDALYQLIYRVSLDV